MQLERNRWMVGVETLRPSIYSGSFGSGIGKIIYFSPILFRVGESFIFGQTGIDKKRPIGLDKYPQGVYCENKKIPYGGIL